MPLETATYISDLVPANPAHSDNLSQTDAHERLIKQVLQNTFPNINGAVTAKPTELNLLTGATAGATVPTGTILVFGGATLPTGYLWCDGSPVNRTTYAALFTALGTAWGAGDGSTTFNLPQFATGIPYGGSAQPDPLLGVNTTTGYIGASIYGSPIALKGVNFIIKT